MTSLTLSRHLLWKDYRQIKPALIGCWAIYTVILLLLFVQQLTVMQVETFFPQCIMLVLSAPTLVAMAASGILIGHERQTRTWNWSSSLPISWYSAMLSKFVVWLASSVVMVLTLGMVYLLLAWICRLQGLDGSAFPEWISPEMIVSTVVIVPLAVYICFSLAALLWNDTLTAFIVSACVVSALYVLTSDLLPRTFVGNSGVSRNGLEEAVGIFFTIALLIGLAGYAMIRAYHWRWTQGQLASIGWRNRAAAPTSRLRQQTMWQSLAWSGPAPSEFGMLLTHAMKCSFVTRLCVFIPTFFVASLASVDANIGTTFLASWVNALILGVTVFAGDQTQSSYKFFADRGVRWSKLLCAHTLPPLLLAIVPALLATLIFWLTGRPRQDGSEVFWLVPVTLAMFGVGLFCSLCSSIAMLSITLAVGALILSFLAMKQQFDFWHYLLIGQVPTSFVVAIFSAQVVVLCLATIILVRRWLVFDRIRGGYYYMATLFIALVPVHLIALSLCFLSIPVVPWPGMDPSQVKVFSTLPKVEITPIMVPGLRNFMFSTDPAHVKDAVERTYQTMAPLAAEAAPQDFDGLGGLRPADSIPSDAAEKRKARLKAGGDISEALKQLEQQLDRLEKEPKVVASNLLQLCDEIETSAWIGAFATQKMRDLELARRAWKVNSQLLRLVDYDAQEATSVINSRFVSALLRNQLTAEDYEFLRMGGDMEELQPERVPRETWIKLMRMSPTMWRQASREGAMWWIPFPYRWYQERLAAWVAHQQIEALSGRPFQTQYFNGYPLYALTDALQRMTAIEERLPYSFHAPR